MNVPPGVSDLHARFCSALTHRYLIRVHMTIMLALVVLSGVLAGRLLRMAGIGNMGFRYPAAVLVSYAALFGLIRLWLAYVGRADPLGRASSRTGSSERSSSSSAGWSLGSGGSVGSGGSGGGSSSLVEGGGSGGGGGASDVWEGASPRAVAMMPGPSGPTSGGGAPSSSSHGLFSKLGGGSGGGGGDGDDGLLLLILFGVLVAAVCGAGVYVVYQAPVILSDAAFQAVLAGGFAHTARGIHERSWERSILRATAIPFALVLIFAGIFGFEAHKLCPGTTTARQVFQTCIFH